MTKTKRTYAKSFTRLKLLNKIIGHIEFTPEELMEINGGEFVRNSLNFPNIVRLKQWIQYMRSRGDIQSVYKGVYRLTETAESIVSLNTKPLPKKIDLSEIQYQLLSWLVDRGQLLNGQASILDKSDKPRWVSDPSWNDFLASMSDFEIISIQVITESDLDERTFTVNKDRCEELFSACVPIEKPDKLSNLLDREQTLHDYLDDLKKDLVSIDYKIQKLEDHRHSTIEKIKRTKRKIKKIEQMVKACSEE